MAVAVLLTLLVAATLWYVHMLNQHIPSQRSGLLPRWIGTRAALQGHDPIPPKCCGKFRPRSTAIR